MVALPVPPFFWRAIKLAVVYLLQLRSCSVTDVFVGLQDLRYRLGSCRSNLKRMCKEPAEVYIRNIVVTSEPDFVYASKDNPWARNRT